MGGEIPLPQTVLDRWPGREARLHLVDAKLSLERIRKVCFKTSEQEDFLRGQAMVVLGCGSLASSQADHGVGRDFEPWMPRYCWACGADPIIGVDFFPGAAEDIGIYDHRQGDLVELVRDGRLSEFLSDVRGRVKLIELSALWWGEFESATLVRTLGVNLVDNPYWQVVPEAVAKLRKGLSMVAKELLQEGGALVMEDEAYVLNQGKFIGRKLF